MTPDREVRIIEGDDWLQADETAAYLFNEMTADDRVWLALVLGEIVGGLRLTLTSGDTGVDQIGANVVVHTVSVHEAHQGRGYGRTLMEFAERWVRSQRHLPKTLSLAVEVDNAAAIGLYESLGYRFVFERGERLRTGDQRCFVMSKALTG